MSDATDDRLRSIFGQAAEMSPIDRAALLDRVCADNTDLRRRIDALLAAHDAADHLIDEPVAGPGFRSITETSPPMEGRLIGDFLISKLIGSGGMGVVYRAEQQSLHREVALKLIRPGVPGSGLLRRFEREAIALARLRHPGIATIHEFGTIDLGSGAQPFLAMELIDGPDLITYAADLPIPKRLELLARICDAVHHAHTRGIIHRDLKPDNILVDREGQPKILDFGIARMTDPPGELTLTRTGERGVIGTVAYMSPEQLSGSGEEPDLRSDVYALGVIGYRMLGGRMPHDLTGCTLLEAARRICAETPVPLHRIHAGLRGDIEAIIETAMAADLSRRYQSAAALADDIRRHLRGEPIAARPASTWYQLRSFSRRNRGLVTGVAAAFVILVAGIIAAGLALNRALSAEQRLAVQLEETQRAQQAELARAEELQIVSDFQAQMLAQIDVTAAGIRLTEDVRQRFADALQRSGVSDPDHEALIAGFQSNWSRVNATDAALALIDETILTPAVHTVDQQFRDQPIIRAQLQQVLADRYRELGLYGQAEQLQERVLAARRSALGDDDPQTIAASRDMGTLYIALGRNDEAEPLLSGALERGRRVQGSDHPQTLTSLSAMGSLLQAQGKLTDAEPYYRDALEVRRRTLGNEHPDTLSAIGNMGVLLWSQGKLDDADPYFLESLEIRQRVLGEAHPDTLVAVNNMGFLRQAQGRLDEAEPYYRQALQMSRSVRGETHPDTLTSMGNMGFLLQAQGKLDAAEPYYREALDARRRVLGDAHPDTLTAISSMGFLLQTKGAFEDAEEHFREALHGRRQILGEAHPDVIRSLNNMGGLLWTQGRHAEVEPYYREAIDLSRRVLGDDHPNTLIFINNMGALLRTLGRLDEAEPYARESLEKNRLLLGEAHPSTLTSISNMGTLLHLQGRYEAAAALLTPAETATRAAYTGGNAHRLASFLTALGRARVGLGFDAERFALAESNLLEAHEIFTEARGESHTDTLGCAEGLRDLYEAWHTALPEAGYDEQAAAWRTVLREHR